MIRRPLAAASIAIALGVLPCSLASAASPTAILGSFFERTNAVLRSADPTLGLEEPRRAIRLLITEVFDFREAAAAALGPPWRTRTAKEQEEFIQLFADLLERGYIAAFSSKARLDGGISVEYLGESVTGETATVPTRVLTRAGESLAVDYRLGRRGDGWTVRDVMIDGVSMVANYRAQFARILGTSSFPELVARMSRGVPVPAPAAVAARPAIPPPAPNATAAPAPAMPAPPMEVARNSQAVAEPTAPAPRVDVIPPARPAEEAAGTPTDRKPAVAPPDPGAGKLEQAILKAPVKLEPLPTLTKARMQFWVQLGTFQTIAAAKRLVERLRPQVASISTDPTPQGSAGASVTPPVSRVRVGPFEEEATATAKLRQLRALGYPGLVVFARD